MICNAAQLASGGTILKWLEMFVVCIQRLWSGVDVECSSLLKVARAASIASVITMLYTVQYVAVQVTLETRLAVRSAWRRYYTVLCSVYLARYNGKSGF